MICQSWLKLENKITNVQTQSNNICICIKKSSDDLYKTRNNYKKIYIYGFTKNIKKQSSNVHVTTEKTFLGAHCRVLDMWWSWMD